MLEIYRAIGLMSGTSLDGIDVALIETDGRSHVRPLGFLFYPYEAAFREWLRACFGKRQGTADPMVREVEGELTTLHAKAVAAFLAQEGLKPADVNLIGFHGQTIWHNPAARETIQIGDGALLAKLTGIDVVNDFRTADVKAGGQGAPLVPLYHRALAAALPKPTAIINIGGVSNITWIGGESDDEILAFDLGTGNALIDDWMLRHTGQSYDQGGAMAAQGCVDEAHVAAFLSHPFFAQKPPKSLDRDAFAAFVPEGVSPADGAATLTMMTVAAIAKGVEASPQKPCEVYIAGGGRHNVTMMRWLAERTGVPVKSVDELGWNGDSLEAEAFAYLAVRSLLGLPLSVPNTTAVPAPMTGGVLHHMD
ncbi:MAG: anhydro-N-acetylmuramic acid kinase [Bdellovibrionales bacterium]|jgi:anhydro-N-acetylmuramic acid kinase